MANPNLLAALAELDAPPSAPVDDTSGYGGIVGRNLGNLLPNAINAFTGGLEGIANLGAPAGDELQIPDMPQFVRPPQLAPDASGGQKFTNLLTQGLLPELAALFVPFAGASKLGEAAGLGKFGQVMAGNVAQGAFSGAKYGPEAMAEGAITGGLLSGVGAIPGLAKRALLAAPLAGIEYGMHSDQGPGYAATAAASTFLGGILPSISHAGEAGGADAVSGLRLSNDTGPLQPVLTPGEFTPSGMRLADGPAPANTLQSFLAEHNPAASTPSGLSLNPNYRPEPTLDMGTFLAQNAPEDRSGMRLAGDTRPQPTLQDFIDAHAPQLQGPSDLRLAADQRGPIVPGAYPGELPPMPFKNESQLGEIPVIGETGPLTNLLRSGPLREAAPPIISYVEAEMPGVALAHGIPRDNPKPAPIVDVGQLPPATFEPTGLPSMGNVPRRSMFQEPMAVVDENALEASREAARKSKLQGLPEHQRTQGGFISNELRNTLAQSAVGGGLGAIVDANVDSDVNFTALGAGLPLLPALARGLKGFGGNEVGALGVLHPEINRVQRLAEGLNTRYDAFDPLTNQHQLTLLDNRSTIYVPKNATPEEVANAIASKRAQYSGDQLDSPEKLDAYLKSLGIPVDQSNSLQPLKNVSGLLETNAFSPQVADTLKPFQLQKEAVAKTEFGKNVIRDAEGEPKVFFHGTSKDKDFNTFKIGQRGSMFAEEPKSASGYALDNDSMGYTYEAGRMEKTNQNPRVLPVFLHSENPYVLTAADKAGYKTAENYAQFQRDLAWKAKAAGHDSIDWGDGNVTVFKPEQIKSATGNSGLFSLGKKDIRGIASPEVLSSLAGGIGGGLAGYAFSEGDPFAAGAGAIAGAIGGGAIAGAFKSPSMAAKAALVKQEVKAVGSKVTVADLTNSLKSAAKDLTEGNTYGQGGPFSRLFDFVDKQFRVSMTPQEKSAITEARGRVASLSERAVAYMKPYLSSGVPAQLAERANKYLDGISQSVTEEFNYIKGAGGIDDIEYNALKPSDRKNFTTWRVSEDTANPKGVGPNQAFKLHVPVGQIDQLKDGWNQKLTQDFLASVSGEELPVAQALVKARQNFNEIQRIFERALPPGPLQTSIVESVGRYVPRMFRAFTDGEHKITDADIKGYVNEFGLNKRGDLLQGATEAHEAYDTQTFTNLLTRPNQSTASQARLASFVPYTVDGRNVHVTPAIRDQLEALKDDVHLENMIRSHLQELGASEKMQRTGAATGGLDPMMFKPREDLTPGYRKLLGEYTDPIERMAMAFSRTYAPAQAASLMDLAKNIKLPSGLRTAYEPAEWTQALQRALSSGDEKTVQALKQMKLIGKSAVFGEYAGNYVSRHLADYFEGGSQIWNQSIGRGISEFNRFFKTGHVPLNPISHIRQIMSIPIFLAIGKAAPSDVRQAWNALFAGAREEGTLNAITRDELLNVGAWTSDLIKGELQGNIDSILSGRHDSEIMKLAKGGMNKVLEAYRKPDMLVRAATYIGAKRRALAEGLSQADAQAKAIQWMDDYTMNYDNIAPAVRFIRNIPGFSPFISYQAEMVRLVKNMIKGGVTGDPERLATLGLVTAVPLGIAAGAEAMLSPEDKKAWLKTKALMPDYNQGKILIPTGKNPNGSFKYWDISPDIAHSDLIKLVSTAASGDVPTALAQNAFVSTNASPILQAISKVVTKRDPRTGQELGSQSASTLSAVSDILPPITPGLGYEWKRLANVEVENQRTGKKESWGDWATRLVTGVSGSSARLSTLENSLKQEFNRTAANARADYLRVAGLTGDNPGLAARKTVAYENYRQTMADALAQFKDKMAR